MEELIRKIEANYIALANLKRIKKQNHMSDDEDSYLISKNSILKVLNEHLEEYKKLTGTEFEISKEINNILSYGN
jgi:hypothetical protein